MLHLPELQLGPPVPRFRASALENRDGLWTFEGDKYTGYLYEVDGDFVVGEVEVLVGEPFRRRR